MNAKSLMALFAALIVCWAAWMSNAVVELKSGVAELRAEIRYTSKLTQLHP